MSIEYDLEIRSTLSAPDVLRIFHDSAGLTRADDHLMGSGIDRLAVFPRTEGGKLMIQKAFGFTPDLLAIFVINKNDWQTGTHTMLHVIMSMLQQTRGDCTLLFNGESLVFLYKDGTLTLNNDFGFWTPDNLACVTLPHHIHNMQVHWG